MSTLLAVLLAAQAGPAPSPELPACAEGWKLEVVAQAPRLRHPSVVACAPDGRIFVGEDPIDMEGPIDQPGDRIVCLHPDGRLTVFADRLGPVFGLMYLEGKLFVQHVPKFSVFRDDQGIGRDRVDLIECTNPTPSAGNGLNDHIPSNFHLAMDGFLYMSVGQKGVYGAVGTDGRRFEMREGGILRMRPEATGLEIYARGVRNILDVALTSEDEIFVYDNDDHTKTWKVKILHMVDGGYYGFPWDIKPARPYTLGGVCDFAGGAPTGALAYTEDALPADFRDNLILCDWGRRTVFRVRLVPEGASYRAASIEDLIPPGPNDFRPVGLTLSPDGTSFYIADWNFAGWKQKKEAGRLLRLSWKGASRAAPKPSWYGPWALGEKRETARAELRAGLSHPSKSVRLAAQRLLVGEGAAAVPSLLEALGDSALPAVARRHALWALDALDGGREARPLILKLLNDPDLRLQAIRQLGTRAVGEAGRPLAELLGDRCPPVRLQAATALGRIGDPARIPELLEALADEDAFVRHSAFSALHRIGRASPGAWPAIGRGLLSDRPSVREGTLYAMRETHDEGVVRVLAAYVRDGGKPAPVRAAALGVLAELELRPPPWDGRWWRNGPYAFAEDNPKVGPRIDRTEPWEGTAVVRETLREALEDRSPLVRARAAEPPSKRSPPGRETPKEALPGPPRPDLPRVAPEPYAEFAGRTPGNATRGRAIFFESKGAACSRCHKIHGEGGDLGPDLGGVGLKYDRGFLIESILYPSRQIAEGYAQTMIRTRGGRVVLGRVRSETSEEIALVDQEGKEHVIPLADIDGRKVSELSLMPDNLQAALSLEEFADLVAFLASLRDDEGFVPLFGGKDLSGWKKDPQNVGHWTMKEGGVLFYDGMGRDLWTEKSFGDFVLKADWRFPPVEAGGKPPVEKDAPVILPDGSLSGQAEKVQDGGDSGIFLRGSQKSQVNIWCWPIGSGEVYGFRTDPNLPAEVRRGATPKLRADRPVGQWNHFVITMKGERLTVVLNDKTVIDRALLPGVPPQGPIGLQHPGNPLTKDMPLEFKDFLIKELK
jgi:putative membrane-bound dehydrogenase-like protein